MKVTGGAWRIKASGWLGAALVASFCAGIGPVRADDESPSRVGRVSDFGGELYLAPQDRATDWATIGVNYPITSGDNLWVAPEGRAEIDFGSGQLRLAGDTNLQVTALDEHRFALFVASGQVILRLRTLDPGDSALVDTPNSQIRFDRPGNYRVDVAPERQQAILMVREGEAAIRSDGGTQQVLPGQMATISALDATGVLRNGFGSDGFDAWSAVRDRWYDASPSAAYVSPEMVGASDLDRYGAWESYTTYGNVWFPTTVAVGWAPYRFGRWTWVGPWGWTWVDDAPWGYAPFHYGRWVWLSGRWGWCPGTFVRRPVWAPALVGWFGGPGWSFSTSFGAPIYGWVPLSWGEPFWPHWSCSATCWRAFNRPFAVSVTERTGGARTRFANSDVPGAITAVPGHVLTGGKPVAVNLVRQSPSMLSGAPLLAGAPPARANPLPVAHRPPGAPPPAALLQRARPATFPSAMVSTPSAPALPSRASATPAPNGGRVVSGPPPRESAPGAAYPHGRAATLAPQVYGGVTDGRGAYTGMAPTPGPKVPAAVDRGYPMPPTMIAPTAPPAPRTAAPAVAPAAPGVVIPEGRYAVPREPAPRSAPAVNVAPGINAPSGSGLAK